MGIVVGLVLLLPLPSRTPRPWRGARPSEVACTEPGRLRAALLGGSLRYAPLPSCCETAVLVAVKAGERVTGVVLSEVLDAAASAGVLLKLVAFFFFSFFFPTSNEVVDESCVNTLVGEAAAAAADFFVFAFFAFTAAPDVLWGMVCCSSTLCLSTSFIRTEEEELGGVTMDCVKIFMRGFSSTLMRPSHTGAPLLLPLFVLLFVGLLSAAEDRRAAVESLALPGAVVAVGAEPKVRGLWPTEERRRATESYAFCIVLIVS